MFRAVLGLLLSAALLGTAYAEIQMPTCEQMKAGYETLTSGPISAEDGSLEIAVNALADNKLMAHDETRSEYASRERIAEHLKTLKPIDALIWVFRRYDELEIAMKRDKCEFTHKDIRLMAPKPVTPTCKQTGPLPDKLLPKKD